MPAPEFWLERQRTLATFGRLALTGSDLEAVLHEACRLVANGLDCPIAKILEWRREQDALLLRACVGIPPEIGVPGKTFVPAGANSAAGYALMNRIPTISEVATETRFEAGDLVRRLGVRHSVNVPIAGDREPYGILEVDRVEDRPFDDVDVDFLATYAPLVDAAVSRFRDAAHISHLLREKEVLLDEVQHRVKNDLASLVSIVNLQLGRTKNAEVKEQFQSFLGRIDSLRLVYDHLYKAKNHDRIDLGDYLKTLAQDRIDVAGPANAIRLDTSLQPLVVDRQTAIALGLIANEFITNSLKHAFPRGSGTIQLSVSRVDESRGRVVLADDGEPSLRRLEDQGGSGMRLIGVLAKQIQAEPVWSRRSGTQLELVFEPLRDERNASASPATSRAGAEAPRAGH